MSSNISPGDVVVGTSDGGIVWKHAADAEDISEDEMLTSSLSTTELMFVITVGNQYAFVIVKNQLGYIARHRVLKAF